MTLAEHRAAARIAWRQARRAKGRSVLIGLLVAIPIAALAAGGFVITSAIASPEDRATRDLGSADLGISYYSSDLTVQEIVKALPPGSRVSYVRAVNFTRMIDGGPYGLNVTETSVPADRPPFRAQYVAAKGRMPHAAGEVAIQPRLAGILKVKIGDELRVDEFGLRLRVVGLAVKREEVRNLVILAGPGTLDALAAKSATKDPRFLGSSDVFPLGWLIDLPDGVPASSVASEAAVTREPEHPGRFGFYSRASVIAQYRGEKTMLTGAAFGGTVGALFGTGLIAAAAFGVGARRQLRTLGLVGATGGEPRHARAIVLWGGTVLGAAGSAAGVVLAIAVALAVTPHIDSLVGRVVDSVQLPWVTIVGAIILGTVAATGAAYVPARHAAKLATVDALAGRTPKPKPAGKLARRGIAILAVGGTFVALGAAWTKDTILAGGFVVMLIGFLLAIPLMVTALGRLPARMPASLRLAARQTARYGRRTGAAVAAATIALTAPVAVASYTMSIEAESDRRIPLRADQLLLSGANDKAPDAHAEVMAAAQDAIPGSVVAPIRHAVQPAARAGTQKGDFIAWYAYGPEQEVATDVFEPVQGSLAIGDATVLRALDAEEGIPALDAGKIVAVRAKIDQGSVRIASAEEPDTRNGIRVPAVAVGAPTQTYEDEIPWYYISARAAARFGLGPAVTDHALLRAPHTFSREEIARVRRAISGFEGAFAISRENLMFHATPARLLVTGGATILALIIVAVAVSLVAAESRREYAVVVAVGAGPGIRRRTVAANAFFVTALAGVVAVVAGFVPVAIISVARTANQPIVVPWAVIGIVAVGAPLIAGAIAGAVSRQPTSRALLQPVW
jgi:putative ABC transport system permease protein